eukprot:874793-Amphidinium_carterae.1
MSTSKMLLGGGSSSKNNTPTPPPSWPKLRRSVFTFRDFKSLGFLSCRSRRVISENDFLLNIARLCLIS